jgi:hypothetical protein
MHQWSKSLDLKQCRSKKQQGVMMPAAGEQVVAEVAAAAGEQVVAAVAAAVGEQVVAEVAAAVGPHRESGLGLEFRRPNQYRSKLPK